AVVDDLPLQIGQVDGVEVGQVQLADARGGQVQGHGRAETAEADDQRAAALEPELTFHVDLRQQYLPAVAQQFFVAELHRHADHCPSEIRSWPPRSRRLCSASKPAAASSPRTASAWS